MTTLSHFRNRALPAAAAALLLAPALAEAHGLDGDPDPGRPVTAYLLLGIRHMIGGWDHLLFIVGVVLLAGALKPAAKLVTLFVAGHSLTLLVAALAGWRLDPTLVDVVIALSLVYVGVQGIRGRPDSLRAVGAIVFAFGLMHGLGLATRLQDLGLPDVGTGALALRIVTFNVGIEIGQLAVLALTVGVGTLIVRHLRRPREVRRDAFAALAATGVLAAAVLPLLAGGEDAPSAASERARTSTACTEANVRQRASTAGGHPAKPFYGPRERPPAEDLSHVLGDGYVIVRYRPDLGEQHVAALRRFVGEDAGVIGAPDRRQVEPVRAVTAHRTLTCSGVDLPGLAGFRDRWLAQVRR